MGRLFEVKMLGILIHPIGANRNDIVIMVEKRWVKTLYMNNTSKERSKAFFFKKKRRKIVKIWEL